MNSRFSLAVVAVGLILGVGLFACGGGEHHGARTADHEPLASSLPDVRETPPDPRESSLRWVADLPHDPVQGVELEGRDTFHVARRTTEITRYPCRLCHTVPVASMRSGDPDARRAHWEITMDHAPSATMDCMTCHAGGEMDSLRTLQGETFPLDQSYRLCGQCHSTQLGEWVDAAHGKRFGGWAEPRVVASCTHCHNPHTPALEPRLPARMPELSSSDDDR